MQAIAQAFAGGAIVEGDRRHAAGQRFERHVAEGLAVAGEHEQVGAGEVAGQCLTPLQAAEDEVGVLALQGFARRAVADPDEAGLRALPLQGAERIHREGEVLLGGDAADEDRRDATLANAPQGAQHRVAMAGIELAGVDRAREPHHVVETFGFQQYLQFAGRDQGGLRAVVEAAHPAQRDRRQHRQAVVVHVGVEAGVEAGGGGDAELACRAQGGPAQRALGGHVDGVGAVRPPMATQFAGRRQPEFQAGVAGQARTAHQEDVVDGGLHGIGRLARANDRHRVAAFAQALFQPLHCEGDAVDFRRIGLGDDGVAHATLRLREAAGRG